MWGGGAGRTDEGRKQAGRQMTAASCRSNNRSQGTRVATTGLDSSTCTQLGKYRINTVRIQGRKLYRQRLASWRALG